MANATHHDLMDLFSLECDGHLRQMRAHLPALAQPASADAPDSHAAILDSLHTLAGAAHAAGLDDLVYLCRSLEALAGRAAGHWSAGQRDWLEQGLALAPALLAPGARVRNRMLALAAQCTGAGA